MARAGPTGPMPGASVHANAVQIANPNAMAIVMCTVRPVALMIPA